RIVHVPKEIAGIAVEPVVDQLGNARPSLEGAIEGVMVDAVLGEEPGEAGTVAGFHRPGEVREHVFWAHSLVSWSVLAGAARRCWRADRIRPWARRAPRASVCCS